MAKEKKVTIQSGRSTGRIIHTAATTDSAADQRALWSGTSHNITPSSGATLETRFTVSSGKTGGSTVANIRTAFLVYDFTKRKLKDDKFGARYGDHAKSDNFFSDIKKIGSATITLSHRTTTTDAGDITIRLGIIPKLDTQTHPTKGIGYLPDDNWRISKIFGHNADGDDTIPTRFLSSPVTLSNGVTGRKDYELSKAQILELDRAIKNGNNFGIVILIDKMFNLSDMGDTTVETQVIQMQCDALAIPNNPILTINYASNARKIIGKGGGARASKSGFQSSDISAGTSSGFS
jgi:hypothetical protein